MLASLDSRVTRSYLVNVVNVMNGQWALKGVPQIAFFFNLTLLPGYVMLIGIVSSQKLASHLPENENA